MKLEGYMKRFFEKRLKIYEHEVARFTWLAVIFFAVFFVTAIFRNYVDTAFLKRYGPDYIPWMLVISALLTMVVLAYADRIAKRFSDTYLMTLVLAGYAAGVTLCWLMVKSKFTIVYPILYQFMGLLDSILLVYLWNIAGDLFDARQGKAHFSTGDRSPSLGHYGRQFSDQADHHCHRRRCSASGLCSGLPSHRALHGQNQPEASWGNPSRKNPLAKLAWRRNVWLKSRAL